FSIFTYSVACIIKFFSYSSIYFCLYLYNMSQQINIAPRIKDRIVGESYIFNNQSMVWNGKTWRCKHDRHYNRCQYCKTEAEEYAKNNDIQIAPKNPLDRVIGQKYLVKNNIHIWSGERWHCIHNNERSTCPSCES